MWGTKVLSFLCRRVLPKKIQPKLVGKVLQNAPTVDCGVFAKARAVNKAMRNSIIQAPNREMGKPIDFEDLKDALNSNKEAMKVLKESFEEAPLVEVGLCDGSFVKTVAAKSKNKNIVEEFLSKSGRAVDDEEMIIPSNLV